MIRPWSRGEKWLFVGSGFVCLPLLLGSWIYERQNELPDPPSYTQEVPPKDNAFALLVQAVAMAPAFPISRRTKSGCTSDIDRDYTCNSFVQPQPYTAQYTRAFPLKQKVAYLKSAQNSLRLWRTSLSLPLYLSSNMSTFQEHCWGNRVRVLSLARLQARACWQRGDNDAALDWLLSYHRESCRSSAALADGRYQASWIYRMASLEKQRTGILDELGRLSPYLNASQCRRAAIEIQRNRFQLPSRAQVLEKMKSFFMDRAYRVCAGKPDNYDRSSEDLRKNLRFRWANKKAGLAHIERQWNWLIEQEQLPLTKQFSVNNELPNDVFMETSDPFWTLSFQNRPMINEHRYSLRINAGEVVWETAMAARAFQLEQGRLPRTLNELVPIYLKKVENDPFDTSHQLQYSPRLKSYTQWYIGQPIFTKPLPPDAIPSVAGEATPPFGMRPIKGYHVAHVTYELPFLLYSVGEDGRDGEGKDFKAAGTKPNYTLGGPSSYCDDLLAPPEWFAVTALQESNKYSSEPFLSFASIG